MQTDMASLAWSQCQNQLRSELPEQQFNTWIRPLIAQQGLEDEVQLLAPNRFIEDWVKNKFLGRIEELLVQLGGQDVNVAIAVTQSSSNGLNGVPETRASNGLDSDPEAGWVAPTVVKQEPLDRGPAIIKSAAESSLKTNLNKNFTFDSFVEGKSNQLAFAAARQVAENPGGSYNPLFIYGGVGLGKTHLMHAVGHAMKEKNPEAKIVYLHSERFVADMVKALQLKAIDEFKQFYRSVDALLIDDIQFFAGKERSQEEFFHTYNALLEGGQQMILTCDRYPKEIDGVEERLKSRFGWGLTVAVEPPELETRAAILINKAQQSGMELSKDAAFFIAQRIRSNVREL